MPHIKYTLLSIFLIIFALALPAQTVTIHVPADKPTIQAGIDAAVAGDTVLVADGTYTGTGNRDIDFGGKNLVLKSLNGPEVTIIDCQGDTLDPHRGFYFHSGEDTTAVVDGFTIQGGFGLYDHPSGYSTGGGIKCDSSSSPKIVNNSIIGNIGSIFGGGIYCSNSNPNIINNTVINNSALAGGGIYCDSFSNPIISNNTVSANSSRYSGGGIYCSRSNPLIIGNTITENSILGGSGGGIYCQFSDPTIINNVVTGNSVGVDCDSKANCIAGTSGGIGGYRSNPVITNTIIYGNIGLEIFFVNESSPVITYCNVGDGWEGEGNINLNPIFVDPENGNYNLCSQSPCIDAGDPSILDPDSTRSDIGLFSPSHPDCSIGNIWYVSTAGNDSTGDGSSGNPFRTIQHAINVSTYLDSVIVGNGRYVENIDFGSKAILVASNYVFSGDTSDIQNTIIDGDSKSSVVKFRANKDAFTTIEGFTIAYGWLSFEPVFSGGGVYCYGSNPTINNNIIRSNNSVGITCYLFSNPTISNNKISGNWHHGITFSWSSNGTTNGNIIGGNSVNGIFCSRSNPVLNHDIIYGSAQGGISCTESFPTMRNLTIIDNASNFGDFYAAINLNNSSPIIENSIIAYNNAGAAIKCTGFCEPVVTCSDIFGNGGGDWIGTIADQEGINGNFSIDPLFCDTASGDYQLSSFSPCLSQYSSCGLLVGAFGAGCPELHICADANGDSLVNVDDVDFLIDFYFYGGATPSPYIASDLNCDGSVDIADITYLAAYINGTGAAPCCAE